MNTALGAGLLVIDPQQKLVDLLPDPPAYIRRLRFLVNAARMLDVPVRSTIQNPERLGGFPDELDLPDPVPKMRFSAWGASEALSVWLISRRTVIVAGMETHICVYLTVRDLLRHVSHVVVASDATASRDPDAHAAALAAARHLGATVLPTETIVYDWMRSADHPKFRTVLAALKALG
jgi:hypothetical protein